MEAPDVEKMLAARSKALHRTTPEFEQPAIRGAGWIELKPSAEHDSGSGWYVRQHPTSYALRPDVKKLVEKYINMPRFRGRIWACTYYWHPPYAPPTITRRYDAQSVDFWHWRGRGHALADWVQAELFDVIFDDPSPPYINWIISNGWMWTPGGWRRFNPPENGSDPGHWRHIHVTYY